MVGIQKRILYILILGLPFLVSCLSGLEPLPSEAEDLTMSLSVPVGKGEVGLSDTYCLGLPNINLTEDVPEWAKHDTIYYTDTLPVDLSKIYEKSTTITYMAFKLNIWNEYPSEGIAEMFFTDAGYSIVYSFDDLNISKGSILGVTQNGMNIRPGYSKAIVSFNKEQIENLRDVEYLIFHIKIILKDTPTWSFQFFDNYTLTCYLGARVDFVLNNLD